MNPTYIQSKRGNLRAELRLELRIFHDWPRPVYRYSDFPLRPLLAWQADFHATFTKNTVNLTGWVGIVGLIKPH